MTSEQRHREKILDRWRSRIALLNNDYKASIGKPHRMGRITRERKRLARAIKKYGSDKLIPV